MDGARGWKRAMLRSRARPPERIASRRPCACVLALMCVCVPRWLWVRRPTMQAARRAAQRAARRTPTERPWRSSPRACVQSSK